MHKYIESNVPQVSDKLQVAGIEKDMITTERGEYWRLLMPGTYHIRSNSSGFSGYLDDIISSNFCYNFDFGYRNFVC